MTNWQEKRDFEINKAVAEIVDHNGLVVFPNEERQSVYLCECYALGDINMVCDFDPCNSPSDAWHIIVENKISIMNDGDTWEASIDFDGDLEKHGTDETLSKYYEDKNPLRAAMIVFLMIQEERK